VLSSIDTRPLRSMTDPMPYSGSPAAKQWGEELEEFHTTLADNSTKKDDESSKSLSPENNNKSALSFIITMTF
jgi:hypothetical protein